MQRRFISLWFRYLVSDRLTLRRPDLKEVPFIIVSSVRNRNVITAVNLVAEKQGISVGMAAADAKAMIPNLEIIDEIPGQATKLLNALGEWCIRYTPLVALDEPDGLIMDITGCAHLWGGERAYLKEIVTRLRGKGYLVRGAMADTIGAAWAIARFGQIKPIIEPGAQTQALLDLPPKALRLQPAITSSLEKLGFYTIRSFMNIQRPALRRRFGADFLLRLDQALGNETETLKLLHPVEAYSERLACLEPVRTAVAIEIAIHKLLELLCQRMAGEGKGAQKLVLKCYRVDGKVIQVDVGTNNATHQIQHLYKLFELKIATIAPGLGIELFVMNATLVEDVEPDQEVLWAPGDGQLSESTLAELLDRLANKIGAQSIHRYLPQEHYWPERAIKQTLSLKDKPTTTWRTDRQRPSILLSRAERIEVTSLLPDNPPMLFIYKNKTHHIKKADGPERIEREWWLDEGEHRDYYQVEDEKGQRYWVFRSGHYDGKYSGKWFIHGFFA